MKRGFTIVELLIVVVVVSVLAAITIVAYSNVSNRADETVARADLNSNLKSLKIIQTDTGRFPTSATEAENCSTPGKVDSGGVYCVINSDNANTFVPNGYVVNANGQGFSLAIAKKSYIYVITDTGAYSKHSCTSQSGGTGDFFGSTVYDCEGSTIQITR